MWIKPFSPARESISSKGVTDSHEMEADVKNCMHNCARTTILAADTSKLEHVFFVKVMDLSEGDILVLDKTPKKEWVDCLAKKRHPS